MKKLLIVKAGATLDSIRNIYGDFEDHIINQICMPKGDVVVWTAYEDKTAPDLSDVSAIIITGSHSMVSDFDDWSVSLSKWLRDISIKSIPTLGICYGHQLIAQTFGGSVGYHPKGKELGTVNIVLTEDGQKDPLLGVLPHDFLGHVAHSQSALKMPENACILAKNEFEPHHSFVINDYIWGVQFHPEFNAEITKLYVDEFKESLIKEGRNFEALKNSVQEHNFGKMLLKRFVELAG